MNQKLKYLSRITDEFDTVICGINGVILRGDEIYENSTDALIKLYQSGKKVMLASNSGWRVQDMYYFLKQKNVPMNIFHAIITAGEIAHFYIKNNADFGQRYYNFSEEESFCLRGLNYQKVDSLVMSDFIIAENDYKGRTIANLNDILDQALHLRLPLLCVGNNTTLLSTSGVTTGVGALAEQYAMMGGKVISFGKPDVRIANYLMEDLKNSEHSRCVVIGDSMASDMRMGNNFGAKTILITSGIHQISTDTDRELNELSESYGLTIDYFMERLQW